MTYHISAREWWPLTKLRAQIPSLFRLTVHTVCTIRPPAMKTLNSPNRWRYGTYCCSTHRSGSWSNFSRKRGVVFCTFTGSWTCPPPSEYSLFRTWGFSVVESGKVWRSVKISDIGRRVFVTIRAARSNISIIVALCPNWTDSSTGGHTGILLEIADNAVI